MARRTWIIALMMIEFLGFIPVLGIFGLLSNKRFGKDFCPVAAIIWVALYLFTASRLRSLRCPQSGKKYFGNFSAIVLVITLLRGAEIISLGKNVPIADSTRIQTNWQTERNRPLVLLSFC